MLHRWSGPWRVPHTSDLVERWNEADLGGPLPTGSPSRSFDERNRGPRAPASTSLFGATSLRVGGSIVLARATGVGRVFVPGRTRVLLSHRRRASNAQSPLAAALGIYFLCGRRAGDALHVRIRSDAVLPSSCLLRHHSSGSALRSTASFGWSNAAIDDREPCGSDRAIVTYRGTRRERGATALLFKWSRRRFATVDSTRHATSTSSAPPLRRSDLVTGWARSSPSPTTPHLDTVGETGEQRKSSRAAGTPRTELRVPLPPRCEHRLGRAGPPGRDQASSAQRQPHPTRVGVGFASPSRGQDLTLTSSVYLPPARSVRGWPAEGCQETALRGPH